MLEQGVTPAGDPGFARWSCAALSDDGDCIDPITIYTDCSFTSLLLCHQVELSRALVLGACANACAGPLLPLLVALSLEHCMEAAGELPTLERRGSRKYESNLRAYTSASFTLTLSILGRHASDNVLAPASQTCNGFAAWLLRGRSGSAWPEAELPALRLTVLRLLAAPCCRCHSHSRGWVCCRVS